MSIAKQSYKYKQVSIHKGWLSNFCIILEVNLIFIVKKAWSNYLPNGGDEIDQA